MAIHKQNNYISPEVTVVEFKTEIGVDISTTAGKARYDGVHPREVTEQGTEDFGRETWSVSQ